ncbi:hypothetical protein [Pseudomonas sp.]|uniref:hypothetical protein n=1 Tax=Pseudomonas sp. TaxID=306 RepID=UPI003FD6E619
MTLSIITKKTRPTGRVFHVVIDGVRELKRFYGIGAQARANHHMEYLNILAARAAEGGAK